MRVFVTGATGFVGTAIVAELLGSGHRVLGLARSEAAAAALRAMGAEVHRGSLEEPASLAAGAAAAEGVIHAGFIHDFSRFEENCAIDRAAILAMGAALAGSGRPLIVTSGTLLVGPGRLAVESEAGPSGPGVIPRIASEHAAVALAGQGVRAMILRLPPSVHGAGDHGFVPHLIGLAREKGAAAFIGDGTNRWPGVHRADAARLYRLALEHGEAGARYHGVAEEGLPFRAIAEVIASHLKLPQRSLTAAEAAAHFGWIAPFVAIDGPASSAQTRAALGWTPTGPGLLADMAGAGYFGS